jgi:hypothetical protein
MHTNTQRHLSRASSDRAEVVRSPWFSWLTRIRSQGGVLGNDSSFLNALCFVLPLVALGGERRTEPELIVAFSSKMMTARTRGLYREDGEVKYDLLVLLCY